MGYGIRALDWLLAAPLALALWGCHHVLAIAARAAACEVPPPANGDWFGMAYGNPGDACAPSEILGSFLVLNAFARDGALFGLFSGSFAGTTGILYGLGLVAMAMSITIFIARWDNNANSDGAMLAMIWIGAMLEALPRFSAKGMSEAHIGLIGLELSVADIAITTGLTWTVLRIVGETRANRSQTMHVPGPI